ncbi:tyrosine-type recombinase/integrase [Amnibacterium sp.]|uniref:tyrosine-type recombinase/integrase n=1 Tax=Amnibacterium sp. TaxID=1872496 RepID=UPI003F7C15F6
MSGAIERYVTAGGDVRYSVRYRKPDQRQARKSGFRTKRDAQAYLAAQTTAKERGDWIDPSLARTTVGEWAVSWYASKAARKATTLSGYRHSLDKHVLPRWKDVPLAAVTHEDVQAWVVGLSAHLGPSATRQTFLALRMMLGYAVRSRRLSRNVCDGVELPKLVQVERAYLSHAQVAQLAAAVGSDGDIVRFLAYTGLRWGEMAALKVGRVDFARRRLEVAEAVSDPRGVLVWSTPKTHERRTVAFPALLVPLLQARCAGKGRDALVFAGADGGVLRNGNWRQRFFDPAVRRVIAEDPAFPKVTPHGLRHTAASLAISAGANVKAVQRMLGHKSAAMTLDTYASLFEDDMESVAVAMNRMAAQESVPDLCLVPVSEAKHMPEKKRKTPGLPGVSVVAPTGVDPVTFRFSVLLRGLNPRAGTCLIRAVMRIWSHWDRSGLRSISLVCGQNVATASHPDTP